MQNIANNIIYRRQLALMTFFMVIAYKVVMLPKYLAMDAPHDYLVGMAIALLIECLLFAIVYRIVSNTNILYMYAHFGITRLLLLGIVFSSSVKLVVFAVETLDYISVMLFQEGRWLFIILTLLPALGYIAYKGANTIARLGEIVVWAVVATLLFVMLFLKADMDITNVLPLFDEGVGRVTSAMMRHSIWLGDALPFVLLDVRRDEGKLDRYAPSVGLVVTYFVTIGFYLLFVSIYGDVAPYIKYAFSNIGIYNSVSHMLGGVDFPIVCVWILMAIVQLSFLMYSIIYSLEHIIVREGSRRLRVVLAFAVTIAYMLILSLAISGTDEMYAFATSDIRYAVLVTDIGIITLLAIRYIRMRYVREKHAKQAHI